MTNNPEGEDTRGERIEAGRKERIIGKVKAELSSELKNDMELPKVEEIEQKAREILERGDPVTFLLDVFNRDHVGDRLLGKSYIAIAGCQLCSNTEGIHPGTTGKSGTGKSHSMRMLLHQLPGEYVLKGSFSDQAWYYAKTKPGTVIFLDDAADLKDIHREIIKQYTTSYQEPFKRLITDPKNKRVEEVHIAPRCSFWVNSVEGEYELQFLNRQINLSVDEKHLDDIFNKQTEDGVTGDRLPTEDEKWKIAQEIWTILKNEPPVKVKIPFLKDIEWNNKENPRNWPMFQDTVSAFTAIRQFQRVKDEGGAIIADRKDADEAMEIWNSISREQRTKLNEKQLQVMQKIIDIMQKTQKREILRTDLAKELSHFTRGDLTHVLKGRRTPSGNYAGGLLNLVQGLDIIPATSSRDSELVTKHGEMIVYYGTFDIWTEFTIMVRWKIP